MERLELINSSEFNNIIPSRIEPCVMFRMSELKGNDTNDPIVAIQLDGYTVQSPSDIGKGHLDLNSPIMIKMNVDKLPEFIKQLIKAYTMATE